MDAIPSRLCEIHSTTDTGMRLRFSLAAETADPETLRVLFTGGGFASIRIRALRDTLTIDATRAETLADSLRRGLRLLVCGLNPSPYAADTGIPFDRPGNRFWPAAMRAGLVERDRDLGDALRHGVGFTDLVKRTTRASSEVTSQEYRDGLVRLERTASLFTPVAVCFVGLEGVRKAIDKTAVAGPMSRTIGGCSAYLMPSTSGRNASSGLDGLVEHLREAIQCARVPSA